MFKFDQKEITAKDFYKQRQITDIFMIDVNKVIKTNFHGQNVPYDMHYNETALLKIDSVYKQDKKYHPLVHVEECKYTDAEN